MRGLLDVEDSPKPRLIGCYEDELKTMNMDKIDVHILVCEGI